MTHSQEQSDWLTLLDASPHPSLVIDADEVVLHANPSACRRFPAAVASSHPLDRRAGAILGCFEARRPGGCGKQEACSFCAVRQAVSAALRGEPVRRDIAKLPLRDAGEKGVDATWLVTSTEVRQAVPRQVVVILEGPFGNDADSSEAEITELKRTQLALEESRRRVEAGLDTLRGVVEAIDAAIFSVDREYRYTSFNSAHAGVMRALYGAEVELGHPISEYQKVEVDWGMARANLDRALAGEAFVQEAFSGDADRSRRFFEVGHFPVRSVDGQVIGATVIARDVTERRQGQAALRESEDRLRQAQKMEAIGQLAGGVAHDFNNLLTVILASADLGLAGTLAGNPIQEEFEEIRGAGRRAQALTRQLLAFSRRQVLQPQVLDLNEKVSGLEQLLGRLLGEEVVVRTHLAEGLHRVVIDPVQLEQVILNLAVNARDAMPGGGVLSIETANVVLDGAYAERNVGASTGPQVLLAISDTGSGMDQETMARVFEPFFTTKPRGKGTGLGLSTVYGIVKQSGGSIWVYSEPGQGTTFKIYLPQAGQVASTASATPLAARHRARPGESLLVVEDDEQVRRAAVRCLHMLGYAVTAASGLQEANALFEAGLRFTVLLTDVVMPGGSGVEVARSLLARAPTIGVIFMSGYTDDAITQHGVLSPGALFLEKPFNQDSIGRKVREAMDRVAHPEA